MQKYYFLLCSPVDRLRHSTFIVLCSAFAYWVASAFSVHRTVFCVHQLVALAFSVHCTVFCVHQLVASAISVHCTVFCVHQLVASAFSVHRTVFCVHQLVPSVSLFIILRSAFTSWYLRFLCSSYCVLRSPVGTFGFSVHRTVFCVHLLGCFSFLCSSCSFLPSLVDRLLTSALTVLCFPYCVRCTAFYISNRKAIVRD